MALQSTYSTKYTTPIAIGGLGGSGTRVIADILTQTGVYIGDRLNTSLDNLWFTLLFVHESYFDKPQTERNKIIHQSLTAFTHKMIGQPLDTPEAMQLLAKAGQDYSNTDDYFGSWLNFVIEFTTSRNRQMRVPEVWGWKEPNTHIYLDYLIDYFTDLRYIHVIRHGLDMAYSKNQNQARRWGNLLGIEDTDTPDISPQTSFEFWHVANQRAIKLARVLSPDRFLLVNYDDLCNSPETGVTKMLDFLGLPLTNELRQSLFKLPSAISIGRYREHDYSWVGEQQKAALESLGYDL